MAATSLADRVLCRQCFLIQQARLRVMLMTNCTWCEKSRGPYDARECGRYGMLNQSGRSQRGEQMFQVGNGRREVLLRVHSNGCMPLRRGSRLICGPTENRLGVFGVCRGVLQGGLGVWGGWWRSCVARDSAHSKSGRAPTVTCLTLADFVSLLHMPRSTQLCRLLSCAGWTVARTSGR